MKFACARFFPGGGPLAVALALGLALPFPVAANPNGATVAQGTASISSSGNTLSIQTSDRAYLNWQSFNIGVGETTTFIQPSSSSLVWNHINDPNPSQILGTLNANGYVVLQNSSGFYIGGQAVLNTGGLVMTTTPTPMPDLSSGGAWQFDAPPPAAKIINYGQINIANGGPAFLIANDIENYGTISSPQGNLGLYAGQQVLVSSRPDGRGLSAMVTLPQGSVNNSGQLIADAGTIALSAQVVNQGGLVQANSIQEQNGVIEMTASDNLTLGAGSVISAKGDNSGGSPGGMVIARSGNTFSDTSTSTINVAGGTGGGQNGLVEIFGAGVNANTVQSQINGLSASQFGLNNFLLLNPFDITLSTSPTTASASSPNFNVGDLAAYSQIALFANDNIEISTPWTLNDAANPSSLTLSAGNIVKLDDGTSISGGMNWSVNVSAGPNNLTTRPASGTDGIYLNGSSDIQTQNGNINLWAANEVLVNNGVESSDVSPNGIRTLNGGSINVTTQFGDVNTGANQNGFVFNRTAPYYSVSPSVGGISTAAGGNVTIDAINGSVYSFLPISTTAGTGDAGTGAFGPEPGNVTVTAGEGVYGHYVLANGVGTITAGQDAGAPSASQNIALSLIAGSWQVNAPNGNIYLQEVRNPNGVFDNTIISAGRHSTSLGPAFHLFDYAPHDSVDLNAGIGVYLTDESLPRPNDQVLVLYPPTLTISAGSGGLVMSDDVTLFPSASGELHITTTAGGNFANDPNSGNPAPQLIMSDSSSQQWTSSTSFSATDRGATPVEAGNFNPVQITISGNLQEVGLVTTKETQITVGGSMIGSSFSGQNLHVGDVTSINVAGQILNRSSYDFVFLNQSAPSVPAQDLPPNTPSSWDLFFTLALNSANIPTLAQLQSLAIPPSQYAAYIRQQAALFPSGAGNTGNPGFVYDSATGRLGFSGQMSPTVLANLGSPGQTLTVLRYDANGNPIVDANGRFETDQIGWIAPSAIQTLYTDSQGAPSAAIPGTGYQLGGPGAFDVGAGSISLGNSYGILSRGVDSQYGYLAPFTPVGASVDVTIGGDLEMLTSTIAALGGGNVNVTSTGGSLDLGSQELFGNATRSPGFGIFTSGPGNVSVVAQKDINVDGSRIATYDGGNILVESLQGNVNAGSGGTTFITLFDSFVDPATGKAGTYQEDVSGSGILATTLVNPSQVPGSATTPGNITVLTPQGNIMASQGGILQEALNGNVAAGPTITLSAGTPPTQGVPGSGFLGNVDLGDAGVIGGTINVNATGNISGLVISRQNSTVVAQQSFTGTILAGESVNVTAVSGSVTGTIVGITGATVSGGLGVQAAVLSQNANVGGVVSSTLGGPSAPSAVSSAAAGTESKDATAQTSGTDTAQNDDDLKKHRSSLLAKLVARVTVLLQ